ncbi:hypothetical protein AAG570_003281 [Ranatra chinensis]|uniref:Uncharacterized protein n=1 Tax=Ranatra chinensis TaxID=642074 RepID=A0ABD0Y6C4_9HEMI
MNSQNRIDDYSTFIEYLNQNLSKIHEYHEKVSQLRCDASKMLLEAASLFDPELLVELNALEESGLQCDRFVIDGQRLKSIIDEELERAKQTAVLDTERYKQAMREIGLTTETECKTTDCTASEKK